MKIDKKIILTSRKNGVADAVKITSRAELTDNIFTKQTEFLFQPEIIYLKKPIAIRKGKKYKVHIKFPGGGDTLDAKFIVKELK